MTLQVNKRLCYSVSAYKPHGYQDKRPFHSSILVCHKAQSNCLKANSHLFFCCPRIYNSQYMLSLSPPTIVVTIWHVISTTLCSNAFFPCHSCRDVSSCATGILTWVPRKRQSGLAQWLRCRCLDVFGTLDFAYDFHLNHKLYFVNWTLFSLTDRTCESIDSSPLGTLSINLWVYFRIHMTDDLSNKSDLQIHRVTTWVPIYCFRELSRQASFIIAIFVVVHTSHRCLCCSLSK